MFTHIIIATSLIFSTVLSAPTLSRKRQVQNFTNAPAIAPPTNSDLIQKLLLAPTEVDRFSLLQPSDWVFDFNTPPQASLTQGKGGRTVRADRKQFPALIGSGGSVTFGFLGPCGFNTPHVHPRATELNTVVQGSLQASFTVENGAKHVQANITQYQMIVFPQGAMHTEFNPDCTESIFLAAFNSEDPGVQQTAQTFAGFETGFVEAALGGGVTVAGEDLDSFRSLIPANVALGVEECLARCGMTKK